MAVELWAKVLNPWFRHPYFFFWVGKRFVLDYEDAKDEG